jgi:hypothetical protein
VKKAFDNVSTKKNNPFFRQLKASPSPDLVHQLLERLPVLRQAQVKEHLPGTVTVAGGRVS